MKNLSPMTVIKRYKQKGLTLLETILAVAIGAVIIMGVLMYYQTASDNANMAATIKITSDIGNAVRAYAQSPSYVPGKINLATLQSAGLLTTADTTNPWSIQANSLKVSTSGNYLGISFYNVPATVITTTKNNKAGGICASLALQLTNSLPLPSPGTATLNGVTYTFTNSSTGGIDVTPTSPTKGPTQNAQGAAVCQLPTGATSTGTLSIVMDLT
jgi:prepilin-type N-terminal cleavage/methylation domain-containing protein